MKFSSRLPQRECVRERETGVGERERGKKVCSKQETQIYSLRSREQPGLDTFSLLRNSLGGIFTQPSPFGAHIHIAIHIASHTHTHTRTHSTASTLTSSAQFSTGGCAANVSSAAQCSVFTFLLPPALGFAAATSASPSASASLSGSVSQLVSHLASPKTAQTFVASAAAEAEAAAPAEAAAALGIAMAMASSGFSGHLQQADADADVVDVAVVSSRRDAWLFLCAPKKRRNIRKEKK